MISLKTYCVLRSYIMSEIVNDDKIKKNLTEQPCPVAMKNRPHKTALIAAKKPLRAAKSRERLCSGKQVGQH